MIWPGFWILQTKFFRQISTQNCSNLLAIFFLHVTLMWKCHKQLWYPVQSSVHRRLVGRVGNSFCLLLCDGIFYKLLCGFARIWMVSKSKVLRNDVLWYIALGILCMCFDFYADGFSKWNTYYIIFGNVEKMNRNNHTFFF